MNSDTAWLFLGGAIVLGVGFVALRPSPASAMGEPSRGAGGAGGLGLNIGGAKGFTLKVPESLANKGFEALKLAF